MLVLLLGLLVVLLLMLLLLLLFMAYVLLLLLLPPSYAPATVRRRQVMMIMVTAAQVVGVASACGHGQSSRAGPAGRHRRPRGPQRRRRRRGRHCRGDVPKVELLRDGSGPGGGGGRGAVAWRAASASASERRRRGGQRPVASCRRRGCSSSNSSGGLERRRAPGGLREAVVVVVERTSSIRRRPSCCSSSVRRRLLHRRRRGREVRRRAGQGSPHPRPRRQQGRVVDQGGIHRPHRRRRRPERQQWRVVPGADRRQVQVRLLLGRDGRGRVLVLLLVLEGVVGVLLVMALALLPERGLPPRGKDLVLLQRRGRGRRRRILRRPFLLRLRCMLGPPVPAVLAPSVVPSFLIPAIMPWGARSERCKALRRRDVVDLVGEVAPRGRAADGARRGVIGAGGLLSRVVGAEPSS